MDELLKKLQETAGLNPDQAMKAANCVKEYLKDKAPTIIDDRLDDMFGGKKVEISDILREKASDLSDDAKDALHNVANFMDDIAGKAGQKTSEILSKLTNFFKGNDNPQA